ncbi:MAG: arginine decarboxylase [Herpetosiphon sp.]
MLEQTFREYLGARYGLAGEGPINDFISREDGRIIFGDRIDLGALVAQYGAPLEIAFCPLITRAIDTLRAAAAAAQQATAYSEPLVYAYATKANFAEEVVRTAINAGAHYETSSAADAEIATILWQNGTLPGDRWIFCNGSKDTTYINALNRLRALGHTRVLPVIDDTDELARLRTNSVPLQVGVRAREWARSSGGDRFGLDFDQMVTAARSLEGTDHKLVLYHAMVGSQIEDQDVWLAALRGAVEQYCELWRVAPSLRMFNFGGGMPTSAYRLDFQFDYEGFFRSLFATIAEICDRNGVPRPEVVGEFGRYTVAAHSLYLFEVTKTKATTRPEPWYLIDGSLMVSAPDLLIVDQQFIVLPLSGWDDPAQAVRIGGRSTCDSDDVYPRPGMEQLVLPHTEAGLVVAVFGVGAYQAMLGGRGGAHHCLNPEMRRLIVEEGVNGLTVREIRPQSVGQIMAALGYHGTPLQRRPPVVARKRLEAVRSSGGRPACVATAVKAPSFWVHG